MTSYNHKINRQNCRIYLRSNPESDPFEMVNAHFLIDLTEEQIVKELIREHINKQVKIYLINELYYRYENDLII